jgi:Cu/Ag efflux pump CusA
MARKSKSVYERIEETKSTIATLEQELEEAKSHLIELEAERDDLEMRQAWSAIKEKGLSIEDVQKLLAKQKTV